MSEKKIVDVQSPSEMSESQMMDELRGMNALIRAGLSVELFRSRMNSLMNELDSREVDRVARSAHKEGPNGQVIMLPIMKQLRGSDGVIKGEVPLMEGVGYFVHRLPIDKDQAEYELEALGSRLGKFLERDASDEGLQQEMTDSVLEFLAFLEERYNVSILEYLTVYVQIGEQVEIFLRAKPEKLKAT